MESLSRTRPAPVAFTINEAAHELRCSRSHIYALIERGLIRRVHIGHRSLIPGSEIARLVEEGTDKAV